MTILVLILQGYYSIANSEIRTIAKAEFFTKVDLTSVAIVLVLCNIYNKFVEICYKLISSNTPVD